MYRIKNVVNFKWCIHFEGSTKYYWIVFEWQLLYESIHICENADSAIFINRKYQDLPFVSIIIVIIHHTSDCNSIFKGLIIQNYKMQIKLLLLIENLFLGYPNQCRPTNWTIHYVCDEMHLTLFPCIVANNNNI
jgi:hypothetical protein